MRRIGLAAGRALVVAAAFCAAGCASAAHNDVLIFGTDTKVAVDVSTPVAAGGTPEITIGFKRREAVYMPLLVNGAGVAEGLRPPPNPPRLYQGASGGGGNDRVDSYSVFASFGANLRGSRNQQASEAAAGLAQFFATGIAAQHLGANARVAEALAVQPSSSAAASAQAAAAAANERAAAAAREGAMLARLTAEIGPERAAALTSEGEKEAELETLAARVIERCAANQSAFNTYLDGVQGGSGDPAVKALAVLLRGARDAEDRRHQIRGKSQAAARIANECSAGG